MGLAKPNYICVERFAKTCAIASRFLANGVFARAWGVVFGDKESSAIVATLFWMGAWVIPGP